MHQYYIVSGILLILPIIDFAVTAPTPIVQEKRQTVVDVFHIPEDAITTLGKRVDEFDELLVKLLGGPKVHLPKPESLSAAGPSSSAPPSEPAGGTDVEQPLPSIPKEPSPVSSPENAPPSTDHGVNEMLLRLFGDPESHFIAKPEESSAAGPSSSAPPSEPADGTEVKQLLPSIPKEPSPVSSPENAPPSTDNGVNEMLLRLFGHPESHFLAKPEDWSAAGPSAPQLAPADGWTDVEQPLSPIPEEPSPVSSSEHAPQIPLTDDKFNEVFLNLFGPEGLLLHEPEVSPLAAARPSSSWQPSGPADEWTDVEQPLSPFHKELSPVSSPDHASPSPGSSTASGYELMEGDAPPGPSGPALSTISSADHELMGAHGLPNPEPPIGPDHEVMDVPPSSPVSSTNPDPDSPSGKRRKMEKGLWSPTPSGD